MLTMPFDASSILSIVGIDPGTDTLGVAVLSFDARTLEIVSTEALTLHGAKEGRNTWATEIHGDRAGRIETHRQFLLNLFLRVRPLSIASESPFVSRAFPQAGLTLTEVVSAIRHAVMQYDVWTPLIMISPTEAKNAVGVSGKTGGTDGKALMQTAVLAMPIFKYQGYIPIGQLDEHAIDAMAIAYCQYRKLIERWGMETEVANPIEKIVETFGSKKKKKKFFRKFSKRK